MKKFRLLPALIAPFILTTVVYAATPFSIENVGGSLGLGTADAKASAINIINWVLGILALVAVAMIIFAGFIAATASGEERGAKARQVVVGALVGLVIVLLAWAIVSFTLGTASNVTA